MTLKTGRIDQNAEGKLELATVAKRKSPPLQAKLALDGRYKLDAGKLSADVNGKLDESTIKASSRWPSPTSSTRASTRSTSIATSARRQARSKARSAKSPSKTRIRRSIFRP